MPEFQDLYVRLELKSFNDTITMDQTRYEVTERIYDLLNDTFYLNRLTQQLVAADPKRFKSWASYRENYSSKPKDLKAIGKFRLFKDGRLDLIDIRYY